MGYAGSAFQERRRVADVKRCSHHDARTVPQAPWNSLSNPLTQSGEEGVCM